MTDDMNKPNKIIYPPVQSLREKAFFNALGKKASIEGWSHNPWQKPDRHDAKATRIADTYIERFSQSMEQMGYLPFAGVEVNAINHGEEYTVSSTGEVLKFSKTLLAMIGKVNEFYYHHFVREHENLDVHIDKMTALPITKRDLLLGRWHETVSCLRENLDYLSQNRILDVGRVAVVKSCVNDLQNSGMIDPEFLASWQNYEAKYSHAMAKAYDKTIGIPNVGNNQQDTLHGRIYVDTQDELEVCTPALSPSDVVRAVNGIKKTLYEATYDYEKLYADTVAREGDDKQALMNEAPRSTYAKLLRNALHCPVSLEFSNALGNVGEHIAVSVLKNADRVLNYENAKTIKYEGEEHKDRSVFGERNLINNLAFEFCLNRALELCLADDTMLGAGNAYFTKYVKGVEHEKHFISKHLPDGGDRDSLASNSRLEVRSFNDGASNISLSMLAINAAMYATIRAIDSVPDLRDAVYGSDEDLDNSDMDRFEDALYELVRPQGWVPNSVEDAVGCFERNSPTVAMMHLWAEENATDEHDLEALYDEISQFQTAAVERFMKATQKDRFDESAVEAEPNEEFEEELVRLLPGNGGRIDGLL